MKSTASAPGKVILFGEHFVVYGAGAILCAINKRITVTAEPVNEKRIRIASNIGGLDLESGLPLDQVEKQLRPLYHLADAAAQQNNAGISITVESDIPAGVGLGSSSACCVAGAAAVSGLLGGAPREKILEMAIGAERTVFADTSGADCTVCTHGGIMSYHGGGYEKMAAAPGLGITVASSGSAHSTGSVVASVRKFREENAAEFARMCGAEEELIKEARGALERGDFAGVGKMMNQNQEYLEAIGVSNETLRRMVRIGQGAGTGAKITGAGGGGCVITAGDAAAAFEGAGYGCFAAGIDFDGLIVFN